MVKEHKRWVVVSKLKQLSFVVYVRDQDLLQIIDHCLFISPVIVACMPVVREFNSGKASFCGTLVNQLYWEEVSSE